MFGKDEVSLRDILRDPAPTLEKENKLVHVIEAAVKRKNFSHGGKILIILIEPNLE